MNTDNKNPADPVHSDAAAPTPEPAAPAPAASNDRHVPPGAIPRSFAAWLIGAAVVAGLAAGLFGETDLVWVVPERVPLNTMGQISYQISPETQRTAIIGTSARMLGVFGALLGLALGLVGGRARPSPRFTPVAGLIGLVIGAVVGVGASYGGLLLYYQFHEPSTDDLMTSLLMHCGMWGCLGAAAAVGLAIGAGGGPSRFARVVLSGALGAVLGAASFEILGALLFASDETGEPISKTAVTRLLARLLVAVLTALGILAAFGERRRAKQPAVTNAPSLE